MPVLNSNISFEVDLAGWSGVNASAAWSTAQAHDGAASALVTPSGSGTVARVEASGSNRHPVVPGDWLAADGWVRPTTAGKPVALQIAWRNAAGTFLSSSVVTATVIAANTWQYLRLLPQQAPAGAAYACVGAGRGSSPAVTDTTYVDQLRLLTVDDPWIAVRVALDSDPADPAPVWTDITNRAHYGAGGREVKVTVGRQDEQAEIKPTEMGWAVENGDNLFTPNNSASPYAGKWEQGRRCQIAEVVGGVEYVLGTGFLEIPAMEIVDPRSSQPVTVSAVDWMGRLESAPPFDGTLAEQVRYAGGTLAEWWPLSETATDGRYLSAITGATTTRLVEGFGGSTPIAADPEALIKPADADGPPGDDQRYARWAPVGDAAGLSTFADAYLIAPISITAGLTDTIALSAWVLPEDYNMAPGSAEPGGFTLRIQNTSPVTQLQIGKDFAGGSTWYNGASVYHTGLGATTTINAGRPYERHVWRLVTVRFTLSTGLLELYVGADVAVSTTVTAPAGPLTFTELQAGLAWSGGIAHAQVRVGADAETMTRDMHLAQHEHGYRGLHRQTVAERIVTLAGYAGVPATEVDVSAACATPMQVAKLAGVNPAAALRATAATGQDTLVTDGTGKLTAVPRAQRYQQAVTMQIPWGWIGWRGLRYRPDKPVTDVTVTRTGGGSVRRTDRTLAARYGVTGQQYDLDTAIDADPANLASWAATAHGQSRTRAPSIRISMLRRTVAERQALLGLAVGDRIQITGLPAGSPDDVGHLIIQGIEHTIGPGRRRFVQLNTSPLLGATPGTPPYCPMVGDLVSTTAIIAY